MTANEQPLPAEGVAGDLVADLVDLTGLSLAGLDLAMVDGGTDGPLARSIARLLADAARPDEAIAGFNSSI